LRRIPFYNSRFSKPDHWVYCAPMYVPRETRRLLALFKMEHRVLRDGRTSRTFIFEILPAEDKDACRLIVDRLFSQLT
jgi:hypothetical protein